SGSAADAGGRRLHAVVRLARLHTSTLTPCFWPRLVVPSSFAAPLPTPIYWITLSAWKRRVGGIVRPRACAVLRLITSSNLVGCSTGRSAGLAPFRSLST